MDSGIIPECVGGNDARIHRLRDLCSVSATFDVSILMHFTGARNKSSNSGRGTAQVTRSAGPSGLAIEVAEPP